MMNGPVAFRVNRGRWKLFLAAAWVVLGVPTALAQTSTAPVAGKAPAPATAAAGAATAGAATTAAGATAEENPTLGMKFDVVSVRPDKFEDRSAWSFPQDGDGLTITDFPLGAIVSSAYGDVSGLPGDVRGLPGWTQSEHFDIQAKVADSDIPAYRKLSSQQQLRMFQVILEDRFKLKLHQESKETNVYELVVAKNGPKLKEAKEGDTYANGSKFTNGQAMGSSLVPMGVGGLRAQAIPMSALAMWLSHFGAGRMVVDKTGLMGRYDFTMQWAPDESNPAPDSNQASIFTAVEEQLGLKLQPAKITVKFLVIDHIERPSEN